MSSELKILQTKLGQKTGTEDYCAIQALVEYVAFLSPYHTFAGSPGSLNINSQTPRSSKLIYLKYTETIMSVAKEFEAANAKYAASFTKGDLQLPPQRYVDDAHSNSNFYPGPLQKTHLTVFQKDSRGGLHGCAPRSVYSAVLLTSDG